MIQSEFVARTVAGDYVGVMLPGAPYATLAVGVLRRDISSQGELGNRGLFKGMEEEHPDAVHRAQGLQTDCSPS